MKQRNPLAVFFLPFITFGIYNIVWFVKTKNEMNQLGAKIPTAWLLIIPFVNWYWLWEFGKGVEQVTGGQTSSSVAFLLLFFLGSIGGAILQSSLNKVGGSAAPAASAPAYASPSTPFNPGATPAPTTFSPVAPTDPTMSPAPMTPVAPVASVAPQDPQILASPQPEAVISPTQPATSEPTDPTLPQPPTPNVG